MGDRRLAGPNTDAERIPLGPGAGRAIEGHAWQEGAQLEGCWGSGKRGLGPRARGGGGEKRLDSERPVSVEPPRVRKGLHVGCEQKRSRG